MSFLGWLWRAALVAVLAGALVVAGGWARGRLSTAASNARSGLQVGVQSEGVLQTLKRDDSYLRTIVDFVAQQQATSASSQRAIVGIINDLLQGENAVCAAVRCGLPPVPLLPVPTTTTTTTAPVARATTTTVRATTTTTPHRRARRSHPHR